MKAQAAEAHAGLVSRLARNRGAIASFVLRPGLVLLALITWGEFFVRVAWPAAVVDFWRQPGIWVAAKLATEGRADVLYADGRIFAAESVRLGANPDIFAVNAPTTILPYLPLTPFSVSVAHTIWVLTGIACFVLALAILLRALRLPWPLALLIWALVPLYQPWRRDIYLGEDYAPVLLFTVLGGVLAARTMGPAPASGEQEIGSPGLATKIGAGCAFALSCIVRHFYGLMNLVTPFVRRQWAVFAAAVAGYGAAVLVILAWLGPDVWIKSIQFSLEWREEPETTLTAYQSLNDYLMHIFRYDATLNPRPIINWPSVVAPIWWLAVIALLGVTIWAISRSNSNRLPRSPAGRLLPYAIISSVALLISPISEDYHYTQLLFPIVVLGALLWEASPARLGRDGGAISLNKRAVALGLVFVVVVALLAPAYRFYNIPDTGGWHGLIYYPRFYGNVLVWVLCILALARPFRELQASKE